MILSSVKWATFSSWGLLILAVLVFWAAAPLVLAQDAPLIVMGDKDYPPYESLVDGEPVGINVDLWREIAKILGRPLDMRLNQWADSQARVRRGEAKLLSFMSINKQRAELYDFTSPTFTSRFPVFVQTETVDRFDISDLTDKRIAVKKGGFPRIIIETIHPEAKMVFVESALEGFRKLLRGEVDGVMEAERVGYNILRQNDFQGIKATTKALAVKTGHIAVVKGNPALLGQIDEALKALKASGKYDQIADKWNVLDTVLIKRETIRIVIILVLAAIVLILIFGGLVYVNRTRRTNLSLNQEITERKQAEERFRSAFENVTVGSVVIDELGVIKSFNRAAQKIFEHTTDEAIGKNVKILMPEPYVTEHDGYLQNYLKTFDPKIIGIGREVTGLRKNGEKFPMHLAIGEMQVGDSKSFIGSITDLTELKALEQQLRHSQRLEAMGQLTGGVAHDFNNILAVMIGNAALLEEAVGEDEEAKHSIEAIKGAVERGASLTSRLLAFSRKQILSPVTTDVTALVGGLLEMLQRTLGETIDLRVDGTPALWPATIDSHQFENALVNLALNARDAMPRGGILTIETTNVTLDKTYAEQHQEVTPGDYVEVSVSDSGTGIAAEVLEKVFEPFFTTKEVGKGSGLGLSMVFGFAKQSNGHITIHSEVGHGTTVKLYLPRSEKDVAKEGPKDNTRMIARGSERVLIVEDDEHVRNVPVRLLRKQGYVVVEARDGKEAIQHLEDGQRFDLLFTDVVLPGGMSGIEIAEKSKSLQPGIKVLLTTGYAENIIAEGINQDLGAALLSKPYPPAKLIEKVRDILDSGDE